MNPTPQAVPLCVDLDGTPETPALVEHAIETERRTQLGELLPVAQLVQFLRGPRELRLGLEARVEIDVARPIADARVDGRSGVAHEPEPHASSATMASNDVSASASTCR